MPKEEGRKESSEGEDIPSDFFDDFCKDDFMEVIDSWNDDTKDSRPTINEKALDNVDDLRELIPNQNRKNSRSKQHSPHETEYEEERLNEYIRPGSRRDPNKTKQAIKRDKEVKVKELLAKHLESMDDIRPPGTELDDYFDESRNSEKKKFVEEVTRRHMSEKRPRSPSPMKHAVERRKDSPRNRRESPLRKRRDSPFRHRRDSPLKFRRISPRHNRDSPVRIRRDWSPKRREIRGFRYRGHSRLSPSYISRRPHVLHRSPRRSPKRYQSPDLRRERPSRSPYKRYKSRSISQSRREEIKDHDDQYLYAASQYVQNTGTSYQRPPESFAAYTEPYYPPEAVPQPVPAPTNSMPAPNMVPAPFQMSSGNLQNLDINLTTQCDALAKLVADGKLSHEDYLKLAPIKGATPNMDPKERVAVLNRCRIAMETLCKLGLPNRLLMNTRIKPQKEEKLTTQCPVKKFCSPLKRQGAVEYHFSKSSQSLMVQRNKEIIDSIISALSLEKIVAKPKKVRKDMRDASVQTTLPVCDVCDIRESTKFSDMSTSINPEYFSSSVHTQVIEEDLYSSKSMFNPSGSSSSGPPISIAHLTPAQLVSQLAARAKTLKHTDTSHSAPRRNFDDYHRGGNQYQNSNYNNYRY
ncbi:uncharacterized protein LOC125051639 isoform X1 [Pieris napi]|uniref:uncharacterized protein LOC125051639 isoform X1 n=1 Tax=Pieris napi TaxID=78633 RepID=UPI001FB9E7B6|nr:uncharacterized protein LOC125051639 isoform X1 [Pieris napi]XP_047508077.1 uncharacterized protein LOC125051639 isoform X1 [Pieris napi]XP_047508078.1 uncharacterized protein LOC125051639 isoform X1 [Pieris napi]XP_047508079.1 uncharacterized protein LOC125051639 isoform X1 [Pieris napi]